MRLADRDTTEVCHIVEVVHVLVLVLFRTIFLLEYLAIFSQYGIVILVILAILRHLVDKEELEALDATVEEGTLLAEMRLDGFSYL